MWSRNRKNWIDATPLIHDFTNMIPDPTPLIPEPIPLVPDPTLPTHDTIPLSLNPKHVIPALIPLTSESNS